VWVRLGHRTPPFPSCDLVSAAEMHKVLNEKDHRARLAEVVYCGINSRADKALKALYLVATMAVIRKCGRFIPRNYTRGSSIRRDSDWSSLLYGVALQLMYWQVRFTHFRGKSDVRSPPSSDELVRTYCMEHRDMGERCTLWGDQDS